MSRHCKRVKPKVPSILGFDATSTLKARTAGRLYARRFPLMRMFARRMRLRPSNDKVLRRTIRDGFWPMGVTAGSKTGTRCNLDIEVEKSGPIRSRKRGG
jgi:hypothetical protein